MLTARRVPSRGRDEVRLPREKRRNLQHVGDRAGRSGLGDLVHVGQDRKAGLGLHALEDFQALDQARAPIGVADVRFALSYEALKTNGMPSADVIRFSSRAMPSA